MGALQYISTSALSLTLSGNTGVAPFLTLFLVGVIEKSDPTLLYMDGFVEKIIASWPGLVVFGALTILEFVGKCVPVVDEIIDGAMVFVVPIFSVLGSLASHGLFTAPDAASTEVREPEMPPEDDGDGDGDDDGVVANNNGGRKLRDDDGGGSVGNVGSGLVTFLQVILSTVGIFLALLVHLCKMLLRLVGEGCCTCCITTAEIAWVCFSVTVCIFIVPIAIGAAILLGVAAGFGFKSWYEKRQKKEKAGEGDAKGGAANRARGAKEETKSDEERGKQRDAKVSEQSSPENPEYNLGETKDEKLRPLLP